MGILTTFINWNRKASLAFDKLLPQSMRVYGTTDFHARLLPAYLKDHMHVADIGGGKRPFIFPDMKAEKHITLTGIDIDAEELERAPEGNYDETIVADITTWRGTGRHDMVISRSTLEHVSDGPKALEGMASALKRGGILIAFAPCRNALFARFNLLMPEGPKNKLLKMLYGKQAEVMGFKAYYSHCTPSEMRKVAEDLGLEILQARTYWMSNYFMIFVPAHIVWRIYQLVVRTLGWQNLGEGFSLVMKKP
ncbi:MAG: trans-aconitate 2-methyltransferase [Pseudobdellovibrionaceae bacterium]